MPNIELNDLVIAKVLAGRPKDLDDARDRCEPGVCAGPQRLNNADGLSIRGGLAAPALGEKNLPLSVSRK